MSFSSRSEMTPLNVLAEGAVRIWAGAATVAAKAGDASANFKVPARIASMTPGVESRRRKICKSASQAMATASQPGCGARAAMTSRNTSRTIDRRSTFGSIAMPGPQCVLGSLGRRLYLGFGARQIEPPGRPDHPIIDNLDIRRLLGLVAGENGIGRRFGFKHV